MSLSALLVEDDTVLRKTLVRAMETEGYQVCASGSLTDARRILQHGDPDRPFDVILLDLGLPDGDGADLLREIRARLPAPILIISARDELPQKVSLLDDGGDDYLVKPFGLAELFARIRVALRHRGRWVEPPITQYRSQGLEIDLARHEVCLHGQAVKLTPQEFKLLARLVRSLGQVVTYRQLLIDVWGADSVDCVHYLRIYMAQLRAKLETQPARPRILMTEPGVGYRIVE